MGKKFNPDEKCVKCGGSIKVQYKSWSGHGVHLEGLSITCTICGWSEIRDCLDR